MGARARIAHFGGGFEQAQVVAVADGGRRLEVLGELGERTRFELNRATARFLQSPGATGARLELLES